MHPPLNLRKNDLCKEAILALTNCHKDNPYAKFVGVCNDQKWALDKCFKEQKKIKRVKNLEEARRFKAEWEAEKAERMENVRRAREAQKE
mmetsp:Transcript_3824/g.4313  ORF Transcript_3824/g.4313 Transcript_3824/m.4313 type:complete len:90 (-) Transcript_3824:124-393(-)